MEPNAKDITLKIDDKEVKVKEGTTVLDAAKSMGIEIPTLCYHKALEPFGACRICSVEIVDKRGRKRIVTSCNYPVEEGLMVYTKSDIAIKIRQTLLELLLARCPNVKKIQDMARSCGIEKTSFWVADEKEDCILCGLCARVCEEKIGLYAINFAKRGVEREVTTPYHMFSDVCIGCGACAIVCPTESKRIQMYTYPTLEEDKRRISARFLHGIRDEENGVYSEMFSGKSSIDGQDGGMATSLMVSGMQKGLFDAAVVVQRTHGYNSEALVAESVDAIKNARCTKYLRVKMLPLLKELVMKGKRKIAMVGTACEIRSARKIQDILLKEYPDLDLTLIGLFCFEAFDYEKLKAETRRLMGVDLDKSDKTQIKRGKFMVETGGNEFSCSVKELSKAVENGCAYCDDFTSTLADISVGSVGSDDGYSTVLVRSDKGKRLLGDLVFAKADVRKDEVTKLSVLKKNRAKKSFAPLVQQPEIVVQPALQKQ